MRMSEAPGTELDDFLIGQNGLQISKRQARVFPGQAFGAAPLAFLNGFHDRVVMLVRDGQQLFGLGQFEPREHRRAGRREGQR